MIASIDSMIVVLRYSIIERSRRWGVICAPMERILRLLNHIPRDAYKFHFNRSVSQTHFEPQADPNGSQTMSVTCLRSKRRTNMSLASILDFPTTVVTIVQGSTRICSDPSARKAFSEWSKRSQSVTGLEPQEYGECTW